MFTLTALDDTAGDLRARVGDGGSQGFFAGFRLSGAAIARPAKLHANFHAKPPALESRRDHQGHERAHEENGDEYSLFHAKKFPIVRNFSKR